MFGLFFFTLEFSNSLKFEFFVELYETNDEYTDLTISVKYAFACTNMSHIWPCFSI